MIRIELHLTGSGVAARALEERDGDLVVHASDSVVIPELVALRKRVAELEARSVADFHRLRELEALNGAGARAVDALESIEERSGALLREALELYAAAECVGPTREERRRVDEMRAMAGLAPLDDFVAGNSAGNSGRGGGPNAS